MQYRALIKCVADYSGFSDRESATALHAFIKAMAARLNGGERKDLASHLPQELQCDAMAIETPVKGSRDNFYALFLEIEGEQPDDPRGKKQLVAAWRALKDAISPSQISDIRAQLPKDLAVELQ